VPIEWAEKEKYIQKIKLTSQDRATQINLPRMSFDIVGMEYDAPRKKNTITRNAVVNLSNANTVYTAFMAAPWDIQFKLSIYVRNIEDGAQILEQIIPYFQPDYTPTTQLLEHLNLPKDIPIILTGIQPDFNLDGNVDNTRTLIWDLNFIMKVDFTGPVVEKNIIKKSILTFAEKMDPLKLTIANVYGTFVRNELVYQGPNKDEAVAIGYVNRFYNNVHELYITNYQGNFQPNNIIRSARSNAYCEFVGFIVEPSPYITLTIQPNPLTSNANSQYGLIVTAS